MPPKPIVLPKQQIISPAVKAAAAASKTSGGVGVGVGVTTLKQPPKKKKTVVKAKRPGSSNVVVISKDDTLNSKTGVKNKLSAMAPSSAAAATAVGAASDSVQFASQFSSSALNNNNAPTSKPKLSTPPTSAQQLQQFKIERAQIAKRELAEMDAISRAFREDENVWSGPPNVVFPKRYHAAADQEGQDVNDTKDGTAKKKEGGHDEDKKSSFDNPYMTFYGSQSQGWMYGEGLAGIGGRSWMEATSKANTDEKTHDDMAITSKPNTDNNGSSSSFLMDDVTIIDNALKANGLTRNDVTPKAYACFLEQARRYSLELLANAQDYAIHAQRNTIPALLPADLLLAVEMHEDGSGGGGIHGVPSTLPTPEDISDLASEVNRAPLPPIPTHCYNGVALPPVEQQLTARTYDVVNGARVAQRMMRGGDLPSTSVDLGLGGSSGPNKKGAGGVSNGSSSPSSKKKTVGSYGAGKGRQIAVHIKNKTSGSDVAATASSLAGRPGVSGGSTATGLASSKSTTATTKSGSKKGQKRTLTEL